MLLGRTRMVLVNTSHPGDIGRAVYAMKNTGLLQLVLAQPESFPHGDMVARVSGTIDILGAARVMDTLEEALSGCSVVLSTSTRDRRIPWSLLGPRECVMTCLKHLEANGGVTLVFGREHMGLINGGLQRYQFHMHTPSSPESGSLNLVVAAQVLTYKMYMTWLVAQGESTRMRKFESISMLNTELMMADGLELYHAHLERALIDTGFLDPEKPRHLMSWLWRLYGCSAIGRLEMNALRGILTETQKVARGLPYKRSNN